MTFDFDTNSVHFVVVDRNSNTILSTKEPPPVVLAHSTAKPFQILPLYLLGIDEEYDLSLNEQTVLLSSHIGQPEHICVIESLLKKTGIRTCDLIIPPTIPSGKIAFQNWKKKGVPTSKLFHPCIGKHVAMMLVQRLLTGSVSGYESSESITQRMIQLLFSNITEYPQSLLHTTIDFCGVPTMGVPLSHIAIAYKNLILPSAFISPDLHQAINKSKHAMLNNPVLLEGDNCISTIISSHPGLIAKTGSNGLLGIGIEQYNCGIAIKADTGRWTDIAAIIPQILEEIGYHSDSLRRDLDYYVSTYSYNEYN